MKYHRSTIFVIFEKAAKFEIAVCCKLLVALYGLKQHVRKIYENDFAPLIFTGQDYYDVIPGYIFHSTLLCVHYHLD